MLAALAVAAILAGMAAGRGWAGQEVALVLQVGSQAYPPGEPIEVTLLVNNRTDRPLRLTFRTSQRFDLALDDESGKEVWRWSAGRFFLQVIGEEVLKPEAEALRYQATFQAPLKPGRYTIRGRLTSSNWPLQASTTILVR